MQTVILAAGRGTRMQTLTSVTPKPMLELRGRPLLSYKIKALPAGITDVVLVIGHGGSAIQDYFGAEYGGRRIHYARQELLNGTFGALAAARPLLGERFLVMMGDDLYMARDLEQLLAHEQALLAHRIKNPIRTGVLQTDNNHRLTGIFEKQQAEAGATVNCGAYMLDQRIFHAEPVKLSDGEYGLPQTLLALTPRSSVHLVYAEHWIPVSTPEDLRMAEQRLHEFYPDLD